MKSISPAVILRLLGLLALGLWVGGFTFYSAFVIPVLHDELDSFQAGSITQRVTNPLNVTGIVALAIWWLIAVVEHSLGSRLFRWARLLLLTISSVILAFLIVQHRVLEAQLKTGSLHSFYPLHQVYLIASTIHWFVNLALLVVSWILWQERPPEGKERFKEGTGDSAGS